MWNFLAVKAKDSPVGVKTMSDVWRSFKKQFNERREVNTLQYKFRTEIRPYLEHWCVDDSELIKLCILTSSPLSDVCAARLSDVVLVEENLIINAMIDGTVWEGRHERLLKAKNRFRKKKENAQPNQEPTLELIEIVRSPGPITPLHSHNRRAWTEEEDALVSQVRTPHPAEEEVFDVKKVVQQRRGKRLINSVPTTLSDPPLIETYSSPTLIPRSTYVMHGLLDIKKIMRCNKRFLKRIEGNEALKKTINGTFIRLSSTARAIFRHHLQREYVIFRCAVGQILDNSADVTKPGIGIRCENMLAEFRIILDLLHSREDPENDYIVAQHKHQILSTEAYTVIRASLECSY